jgi:hypothetical protein
MAKAHIHTGPHHAIPSTASPGLRFLKAFLPAVDSLNPGADPLGQYLTPNAVFIINGGEPMPAETIIGMMKMRSQRLKTFRHDLKHAWDVEMDDGRRMVMYEAVSVTIFRDDPDEKAIEVPEFSTIKLEPVDGEEGAGVAGFEGLAASVLKTFMDANPIMLRLKQIGGAV